MLMLDCHSVQCLYFWGIVFIGNNIDWLIENMKLYDKLNIEAESFHKLQCI
jgi:hypothetical protein